MYLDDEEMGEKDALMPPVVYPCLVQTQTQV